MSKHNTALEHNSQNSLLSASFQGLLWSNLLTVINDNAFRWLVIGIGKDYFPPEQQGWLLMIGSVLFVAPYLIFASVAGWLADRFPKRNVIVACKFLEIVVMIVGVTAIMMGNFNLLLLCTFLMGTQSALFAPAKVGKIPELLDETRISAANGYFNLAALSGTVIGMAVGGLLKDVTGIKGQEDIWITACTLIGIAVVGTGLSLLIRKMAVANPKARFPVTLIGETFANLVMLFKNKSLFRVALGISFFWAVGALGQLNIDQYAYESGALIERHRTPLLICLILGVGIGSVIAGIVSAGRIELGLVPWGALGISLFSILIFFSPEGFITYPVTLNMKYVVACALLAFLGISAGVFDVPLASFMQFRSPVEHRGAILSAVNFMLFTGILLTSVLYWGMRAPYHPASYANMPDQFQADSESDNYTALREITDNFDSQLASADSSQIELIKSTVAKIEDPQIREQALGHMLYQDMAASRKRIDANPDSTEEFNRQFYYDQFDQPAELVAVKHAYEQSSAQPLLSTRAVFLVLGIFTIPMLIYSAYHLYLAMTRIAMLWFLKCIYRVKVNGLENIPDDGGAVLVGNHTTWIDGALWLILIPRRLRMIAFAGNFKNKLMTFLANYCKVILITAGPKSIHRGLTEARKGLGRGEVVGLFPEGLISKTGQVQTFKPGLMKILDKMPVPIIPVYLDQQWGSIFTYSGGTSLKKWPNSFRRPMTLNIGKPMNRPEDVHEVRQSVMNLSADSSFQRQKPFAAPAAQFVSSCKRRKFKNKLADSSKVELSGGSLLMRSVILKRLLNRHVLDANEKHVGVLIPPSVGGVVVNAALAIDQRVAVNLNYTVSSEIMNQCIKQAGIKHVLTSRKVMEQFKFELDCEVVYLEDFKDKVSTSDKLAGVFASYVVPGKMLKSIWGLNKLDPDDVLTIIFTSGSTGVPKGVMLTHQNIATNVQAMDQVVHLKPDDCVLGILPFFHSFGFMATLWGALTINIRGVYHFSPLDSKQVGKLVDKHKVSLMLSTPTFLRGYLRKCTKEQLESLDVVVTGAEKLPVELADAFETKFGVRPIEGYGATETAPLATLNVPPSRSKEKFAIDRKEGTVGRPVPNVIAKIVDLDSGKELGMEESGMLWIKGPNVMKGYLGRDDLTSEAIQDGWYNTGDVAMIDKDGFIQITGRISRFSKIGGEMVPHVRIEEVLSQLISEDDQGEISVAVTAVPDARKGERLVVLHRKLKKTPEELCQGLSEEGLPNLYIPSTNSFFQVDELPLLGTGKLDLKSIKQMAEELANGASSN